MSIGTHYRDDGSVAVGSENDRFLAVISNVDRTVTFDPDIRVITTPDGFSVTADFTPAQWRGGQTACVDIAGETIYFLDTLNKIRNGDERRTFSFDEMH